MHELRTDYTTFRVESQIGQGVTDPLSRQAKLEFRQRGMGYLAYILDRLYSTGTDLSEPFTLPKIADLTGIDYKAISRAFVKGEEFFAETFPYCISIQEGKKSAKNSKGGRNVKHFTLPDSDEVNQALGVVEPLYMSDIRLTSYMDYKADVSQIPVVDTKTGELSSFELAERAHVSRPTHRKHRILAGTKSFTKESRTFANRDEMPETYGKFLELTRRFKNLEGRKVKPAKIGNTTILPTLHLEWNGKKECYSQRGYDRLIDAGAKPEDIDAVYYKKSHHYARPAMRIKAPKYNEYTAPFVERKKYYYVPKPVEQEFTPFTKPVPTGYEKKWTTNKAQEILIQRYGTELSRVLMEAV